MKLISLWEPWATLMAIGGIPFTMTITAHCAPLVSDGDEIASVGTEVRR